MTLPGNVDRVRVRGYWYSQTGGGSGLPITFTPLVTNLLDIAAHAYISTGPLTILPDDTTAYFFVDLIATNDPDLTPNHWRVSPQTQPSFVINVPFDSPVLDVGGGLMMKALWLVDATVVSP
jgi:hypothetical protein